MRIKVISASAVFLICLVGIAFSQSPIYPKAVVKTQHSLKYVMNIYQNPPAYGQGVRLAIYQSEEPAGTKQAMLENTKTLEHAVIEAKKFGAQLIAFPELYLSGYALSPTLAKQLAIEKNSSDIKKIQQIAKEHSIAIILPYPEKTKAKDGKVNYYDSIALINSKGELLESYKKTHLFAHSEQLNWSYGNGPYRVFKINGFPIGILNCYEAEFPELARILALKGAKLIVIPTAADGYYTKPDGKRTNVPYPDISTLLIPASSYENNIFIAYANRFGYEKIDNNQWHYQGNSVVANPHGKFLVKANHNQKTMLIADVIPSAYGPTHPENTNYLKDRRPGLYHELIKTHIP